MSPNPPKTTPPAPAIDPRTGKPFVTPPAPLARVAPPAPRSPRVERHYYVGNGVLKLGPGHEDIYGNQRIPDGILDDAAMLDLRRRGLVRTHSDDDDFDYRANRVKNDGFNAVGKEATRDPNSALPAGWSFDPKNLLDKDVGELNNLIAEHAKRVRVSTPEPFDTKEEAIAFLSSDFVPPKP